MKNNEAPSVANAHEKGPMQGVGSGTLVRRFRAGDTVFHRPTGETWLLIKDEHDGWVTPGGRPASQGRAEDCKLVEPIENCPERLKSIFA